MDKGDSHIRNVPDLREAMPGRMGCSWLETWSSSWVPAPLSGGQIDTVTSGIERCLVRLMTCVNLQPLQQ